MLEKEAKVTLLSDFLWKMMFFFSFDFHVKFEFLCDFLWKMKSFLSFNSSVLGHCWNRKGFCVCRLISVGG